MSPILHYLSSGNLNTKQFHSFKLTYALECFFCYRTHLDIKYENHHIFYRDFEIKYKKMNLLKNRAFVLLAFWKRFFLWYIHQSNGWENGNSSKNTPSCSEIMYHQAQRKDLRLFMLVIDYYRQYTFFYRDFITRTKHVLTLSRNNLIIIILHYVFTLRT